MDDLLIGDNIINDLSFWGEPTLVRGNQARHNIFQSIGNGFGYYLVSCVAQADRAKLKTGTECFTFGMRTNKALFYPLRRIPDSKKLITKLRRECDPLFPKCADRCQYGCHHYSET